MLYDSMPLCSSALCLYAPLHYTSRVGGQDVIDYTCVCLCVHLCVCLCVHLCVHLCVLLCVHLCVHVCLSSAIHVSHVYMHVCVWEIKTSSTTRRHLSSIINYTRRPLSSTTQDVIYYTKSTPVHVLRRRTLISLLLLLLLLLLPSCVSRVGDQGVMTRKTSKVSLHIS